MTVLMLPPVASLGLVAMVIIGALVLIWGIAGADKPDPEREAEIEAWLKSLRTVPPEQRTPIHDQLLTETFHRQLEALPEVDR